MVYKPGGRSIGRYYVVKRHNPVFIEVREMLRPETIVSPFGISFGSSRCAGPAVQGRPAGAWPGMRAACPCRDSVQEARLSAGHLTNAAYVWHACDSRDYELLDSAEFRCFLLIGALRATGRAHQLRL